MANSGSRGVVLAALLASAGLAAAKLSSTLGSPSSAALIGCVQSLIDTSSLALLLYGFNRTRKAAGSAAPGSQDRQLYFWGFVVAILLYAMGAGIALFEGVERLAKPHPTGGTTTDQLLAAAGTLLAAAYGWYAVRTIEARRGAGLPLAALLRRPANAALFAVAIIAAGAVVGQIVALLGLAIAADGNPQADSAAALGVGLTMMAVAAFMAIEVRRQLGQAPALAASPIGMSVATNPAALPATASATAPTLETKSMPVQASVSPAPEARTPPSPQPVQKPAVVARPRGKHGRGKHRR